MTEHSEQGGRLVTHPDDLRARLLERIEALASAGATEEAEALRDDVNRWWAQHLQWADRITQLRQIRHEINNALVGIRGHAQLLLRGSAGQEPRIRERAEVIIRESERIEKTTGRLIDFEADGAGPGSAARAA